MFTTYLGLALLVGGLLVAAHLRARHMTETLRWAGSSFDYSAKVIGLVSAMPALALMGWQIWREMEPPIALLIGIFFGLGFFLTGIGIFKMEAMLFETESETQRRVERDLPANHTMVRRIAVIVAGLAFVIGSLGLAIWLKN